MNSSFQHCAYNQMPTTELNARARLEMTAMVRRPPREGRGTHKSDVRESRGKDFLHDEAPMPIVSLGVFAWPRIPQNDNATGLQKWHPTLESLSCAARRLVAVE
jgi:hypothetical protein